MSLYNQCLYKNVSVFLPIPAEAKKFMKYIKVVSFIIQYNV